MTKPLRNELRRGSTGPAGPAGGAQPTARPGTPRTGPTPAGKHPGRASRTGPAQRDADADRGD